MTTALAPSAPARMPAGRFAAFMVLCLAAAMLLEDALALGPARPDFIVIALVYGAIRWGAAGGALGGFGLGLFRDALALFTLGVHALGMTLLGYGLGKLRETLYLSAPAVDLALLAGAKLLLGVVILAGAAAGAWGRFEIRFFWEAPLDAAYTAVVGGALYRLFRA